jgi:hypothetical protein
MREILLQLANFGLRTGTAPGGNRTAEMGV